MSPLSSPLLLPLSDPLSPPSSPLPQERRPYLRLLLDGLSLQLHPLHPLRGPSSTLSATTFGAEDLTPGGEDYPVVIRKETPTTPDASPTMPEPMMTVVYEGPPPAQRPTSSGGRRQGSCEKEREGEGEGGRLTITAVGMHLCFTNRFLDLYFDIQVHRDRESL